MEWKIIYVGSASSESYDQTLDSVFVGPVPAGCHKFVFQADAPNTEQLPPADVVGVTVVLLTCSYQSNEFIRVGYYVNNEYADPALTETPPAKPIFEKVGFLLVFYFPNFTCCVFFTAPEEYFSKQSTRDKIQNKLGIMSFCVPLSISSALVQYNRSLTVYVHTHTCHTHTTCILCLEAIFIYSYMLNYCEYH